jgi:GDP-mannose 6-dehydrogenase
MERIAVFGLGYVGCVTAACLARDGHHVIGVDLNAEKVASVQRGEAPLVEPGLSELLKTAVREGRLRATSDANHAVGETDVAIICVGTPTGPDENPDLRALLSCSAQIGAALHGSSRSYAVLIRSTVPPGTAENLVARQLEEASKRPVGARDTDLLVLTVPEFLREASAIADYDDPPFFIVGGPTPPPTQGLELVESLFEAFQDRTHWVSYRTAELLKNVCNAYHAVKVVFANEVGALCEAEDVDGIELMRVFCQDRKLNVSPAYLRPGLPFGGSCLPKDLRALLSLSRRHGVGVPLLGGTYRSNDLHIERAIESVTALGRRRVGLDGLAFKAGTDDVRGSPMVAIAERLLGKGFELKIYDPLVSQSQAHGAHGGIAHLARLLVSNPDELLQHAEVLVRGRSSDDLLKRAHDLGVSPYMVDLGRPPYRVVAERSRRDSSVVVRASQLAPAPAAAPVAPAPAAAAAASV